MVRRFFSFLEKEFSGLHEAALLIGLASLASQFLALIRDRLLAASFGAGNTLDIYYAAFRAPDLIFLTIGSFVSVTVLIPFIIQKNKTEQLAETRRFLDNIFTAFCLVMLLMTVVFFAAAPLISRFVAPGFAAPARTELTALMRIMLLSPFLLGLSNLLGSVTQSYKKFFIYALSPLLYNLGIIGGVLVGYPRWGLAGLAWGVVAGALLHLLIQVPTVWRLKLLPRPTRVNWPELKEIAALSLPRTLTLATQQLVFTGFIALASLLDAGSIAVFNLSFNIQSVPLAIFGVSYSIAAFPTLAQFFSGGERLKFVNHLAAGIRHVLFWSLPATSLFIVLRAQIVRVILGAGKFDWSATRLTAAALALFVLSVAGQSLMLLFVRGYYAGGETRKPLLINLFASGLTVVLGFVLIPVFRQWAPFRLFFESLLRVDDVPGTVILMLPLAFSIGAIVNTAIHWLMFEKDFSPLPSAVKRTLFDSLAGAIIAGFAAYLGLQLFAGWFDLNTLSGIFLQGFLAGMVGVVMGLIVLRLLKNTELKEIQKAFHTRFWKARTIAPEPEEL